MRKKERMKNRGITIIALVITIIILLILAGVSITTLTGDNGTLTKAREASEKTRQVNAEEQVQIAVVGSIGTDGNIQNGELKSNLDKIENITGVPDGDGYFTVSDTIDGGTSNKNNTIIPEGFKPIDTETSSWGDGTTHPTSENVNQGLVIESKDGSQYVWIAVDGEIILGRYVFETGGKINTTFSPSSLGGDLRLSSTDNTIYRETEEKTRANTIAKDINGFIDSVEKNGGYYIARFEASEGDDGKADSKYDQVVWANITQPNAANACLELYTSIESDLMNSYAWDTAVLFIQKNSGDSDYSRQARFQNTLANTGKVSNGSGNDIRCNIYDMAGNCREWTTETSSYSSGPSVTRGGEYLYGSNYTTIRGNNTEAAKKPNFSFRSILYLNN